MVSRCERTIPDNDSTQPTRSTPTAQARQQETSVATLSRPTPATLARMTLP
jgi:hypothetical protein